MSLNVSTQFSLLNTRFFRTKLQSDLKDRADLAVVRSSIQKALHLLHIHLSSRPVPPTYKLVYSLSGVHADLDLLACCMACLAVALSRPCRVERASCIRMEYRQL